MSGTVQRSGRKYGAFLSTSVMIFLTACAGPQTKKNTMSDTSKTATAAPGTLDYDKNLWHQLLEEHEHIRRTVRQLENGVDAVTESDDASTSAKIVEHAKAMQARMKSGAQVRVWDPVFAQLFEKHGAVEIAVTQTDKGVRIVETSNDPEAVALLRSHANGVSAFVREGGAAAPNETPLLKVGDPIPLGEVAIGGVKHRILLGQPDAKQLAALKAAGMSSVLNFRKPSEHVEYNETDAAKVAGLGYCNLPYKGDVELTDEVIDSARAALRAADEKGEATVLHCRTGNRVGPGWAAYRALDKNIEVDQAIAEAKAMQMTDAAMEKKTRDYIKTHRTSK